MSERDELKGMPFKKIYLQWDGDATEPDHDLPYEKRGEISWCQDKIFDLDVEYIRADLAGAPSPQLEQVRKALEQIAIYDEQPIWKDDRDDAADNMLEIARAARAALNTK